MSVPKYLIDTNVFIGLEDYAEVSPNFASLLQLTTRFGVGVYVHAAAVDDIKRDRDEARRRVSLSKIQKFPVIDKVIGLDQATLAAKFGVLRKPNDVVDATPSRPIGTYNPRARKPCERAQCSKIRLC